MAPSRIRPRLSLLRRLLCRLLLPPPPFTPLHSPPPGVCSSCPLALSPAGTPEALLGSAPPFLPCRASAGAHQGQPLGVHQGQPHGVCQGQPALLWLFRERMTEMRALGLLGAPQASGPGNSLSSRNSPSTSSRPSTSTSNNTSTSNSSSNSTSRSTNGSASSIRSGSSPSREAKPHPLLAPYLALNVAPLRRVFSWAVPSAEALAAVEAAAPAGGLLEVGAGTGYWAHLLRARGAVDVRSVDRAPLCGNRLNGHHVLITGGGSEELIQPPPFTYVKEGGPETAAAEAERALFLCWPPPEEGTGERDKEGGDGAEAIDGARESDGAPEEVRLMAHRALAAYQGGTVVFVGELPLAVLEAVGAGEGTPRRSLPVLEKGGTGDGTPRECHAGTQVEGASADSSGGEGDLACVGSDALGRTDTQTGGPLFFEALLRGWRLQRHVSIPQWPLARDSLSVWARKAHTGAGSVPQDAPTGASGSDRPQTADPTPHAIHCPGDSQHPVRSSHLDHSKNQQHTKPAAQSGHSGHPERVESPSAGQRQTGAESPPKVGYTGGRPKAEEADPEWRENAEARAVALRLFREEWEDLLSLDVLQRASRHKGGLQGALGRRRDRGAEPGMQGDEGGSGVQRGLGTAPCALDVEPMGTPEEGHSSDTVTSEIPPRLGTTGELSTVLSAAETAGGGCTCGALALEDRYYLGGLGRGGDSGHRWEECRQLRFRAEALEYAALESFLSRISWRRLLWVLPLLLS